MELEGASNNELLLAAAKSDNEDMLTEVFKKPGTFDVNFKDGLGNTALHYAVVHRSSAVLEQLLCHDECDVDPVNRLDRNTPLHLAVKIEEPEIRAQIVDSLLEAGADDMARNKYDQRAQDLVKPDDEIILSIFRKHQAQRATDDDDIADDDEDEDDEEDESD